MLLFWQGIIRTLKPKKMFRIFLIVLIEGGIRVEGILASKNDVEVQKFKIQTNFHLNFDKYSGREDYQLRVLNLCQVRKLCAINIYKYTRCPRKKLPNTQYLVHLMAVASDTFSGTPGLISRDSNLTTSIVCLYVCSEVHLSVIKTQFTFFTNQLSFN